MYLLLFVLLVFAMIFPGFVLFGAMLLISYWPFWVIPLAIVAFAVTFDLGARRH